MKKRKRRLKVNSRTFSDRDHSNSLALSNASDSWSNLSWNWLPQNQIHVQKEKKNRNRLFKCSIKRKTRHSHAGVLWRQKMNKKSVEQQVQSCCLAYSTFCFYDVLFAVAVVASYGLFTWRCGGGGGLGGTPGTWDNPLRWGNLPENIISHFNFITFTW